MANAIPVGQPEPAKEPKPKAVKAEGEIDHNSFIGKDHPEFGVWVASANGWRKDHVNE